MKKWVIRGNKTLTGTIEINGAKNSLLAILPATIITKSIVKLENVTPLKDTYVMIDILKRLNAKILYDNKSKMIIDARNIKNVNLDGEYMSDIRASYYFMGALLSLFNEARVMGPGGCKFATRPIDLHLYAFSKLGFSYEIKDGIFHFNKAKTRSRVIEFEKISVGATVNAILSSCKIRGKVKLINVAIEPEVDDLIEFLNKCGANIVRRGREIIITGVTTFNGCTHTIVKDRIEAGTYLILGACVGNNLKINYPNKGHLKELIETLIKMGVDIKMKKDIMIVNKCDRIKDTNLICDVYPSIPTDLQQPLSILLTKTETMSILKDNVYPSRYTQIEDLNNMGFKMMIENESLYVSNSLNIHGRTVNCKDLRGGVSLVLAGLLANGETVIERVEHIERGYGNMVDKLKKIGANIYEKN